ncbi:MAG: HEAT repeat domain-containing protein, partial [Myxococcaceae bacterium]|nr:HEAT repeat domain-containing protein [Myxococcaceae bacterium]
MHSPATVERRVRLLQALFFFQGWFIVQGRVASYAWLVESQVSGVLPYLYVGQAVVACATTLALFGAVDRAGRATVVLRSFAVFALGSTLAAVSPPGTQTVAAPLLLLFIECGVGIIGGQFWLLAGELLSPEHARRNFPSVSLAGSVGALVGGATGHLAGLLGQRGLVALLGVPAAACISLALVARQRYPHRLGPRPSGAPLAFALEVKTALSLFKGSRLLTQVAALTALVTASGILIDFVFTRSVAETHTGSAATFLGNVAIIVNVAHLGVVVLLGSKLLTTFGLIRTFFSYPLGGLLAVLLGLPFGAPFPAVALRVFDRLENFVVLNPGLSIALSAFSRERRGRASLWSSGLIKPLAIALTGASLLALRERPQLVWWVLTAGFVLAVPLLARLATVYRESLVENLRSDDRLLVATSIEALAEPGNRVVVPMLLEVLQQRADPVLAENVLRAAGSIVDERFVAELLEALKSKNASMRIAAAGSLRAYARPQVLEALGSALKLEGSARVKASLIAALGPDQKVLHPLLRASLNDADARVRANAVEAIGLSGDPELIGELRPLLDAVSPREIANVIVALARVPAHRAAAVAALERLFQSEDRG